MSRNKIETLPHLLQIENVSEAKSWFFFVKKKKKPGSLRSPNKQNKEEKCQPIS